MTPPTTQPPAPQLALIALSEAATPGPWTVRNNGLWLIEAPGPFGESWVVAEAVEGINIDDVDHTESNARFIAAAVNHFRATQSRPEAELPELPELPEPIGLIAGTRIQPKNEFFGYFNAGYTGENKEHVYTADQLRSYGQQCAATSPAEVGGDGVAAIRTAVADYMWSEGCSCCRGSNHDAHTQVLAKLLGVQPHAEQADYYDFSPYRTSTPGSEVKS